MPKIDYYVKHLQRFQAREMVLASGKNVLLRLPGGDRYATQTTSHADLVRLMEEIAAPAVIEEALAGKPARFAYEMGQDSFNVLIEPTAEGWRVTLASVRAGFQTADYSGHELQAASAAGGMARGHSGPDGAAGAAQSAAPSAAPPARAEVGGETRPRGETPDRAVRPDPTGGRTSEGPAAGARGAAAASRTGAAPRLATPTLAMGVIPPPGSSRVTAAWPKLGVVDDGTVDLLARSTPTPAMARAMSGMLGYPGMGTTAAATATQVGVPPAATQGQTEVAPAAAAVARAAETAPSGAGAVSPGSTPGPKTAAAAEPPAPEALSASMQRLLVQMAEQGGSDLHLSAGQLPILRVDGFLQPLPGFSPLATEEVRGLLTGITPPDRRAALESGGETDFAFSVERLARFRVHLYRDLLGPAAVIRRIPFEVPAPETIGIPQQVLELCSFRRGCVLLAGPSGSGKSTTLAALVDHINNTRGDHVITVERPVEFVHRSQRSLVHQREVGSHTCSLAEGVRAAIREDVDVLVVGELDGPETTATALEIAESGHLVLATVRGNGVVAAIDGILEQFPPAQQPRIRLLLAETLRAALAQALCRRTSGGRIAAFEILLATPAVANLVREGKAYQLASLMQGVGLNDSLIDLVHQKIIEPAEALAHATNKQEFKAHLEREGFPVLSGI